MLKLYSPLTGDFYKNDVDEYGWNNGVADYPTLFSGVDMAYYEGSIQEAVEQRSSDDGGNLMLYFDEGENPGVKEKVLSAIPSVAIRDGELMGCTTVQLKEPLDKMEMQDLQDYLKGQFSDGWGEGFEQQEIQTGDGVLFVHFGEEPFDFTVEQMQSQEQPAPKRPKMKLEKWDGDILSVLKRAERLLIENGQPERAEQMMEQFRTFYNLSSGVISQYVEIELPEKSPKKAKKGRGEER